MQVLSDLHVIHIVESFATGTREVVRLLANQQVAAGMRVSIWHGVVASTPTDPKSGFDPKVEMIPVPGFEDRDIRSLLRSYFWLLSRRNQSSSVVHLHSSVAGILARAARLRGAVPIVYTPHGFFLIRTDLNHLKRTFLQLLERFIDHLTPSVFVACSASEASVISRCIPRVRMVTISNAIESVRVKNVEKTIHSPIRIVAVGRVSIQKNFDDLIRLKEYSGCNVEIRVIGDGPLEAVARLRAYDIFVAGWMTVGQVELELQQADLFLQCSLWEGMPISVMEAMAAGLPVVARDAVGTRDLVRHGETGLVYGHVDELLSLIDKVRAGYFDWKPMLLMSQAMLVEKLSPEVMCGEYFKLYVEQ